MTDDVQMVQEKPYDAFISHASEDKTDVVDPLAHALRAAGLRIWLDRFELRVGDNLRQKIDQGLAQSRFGIVVLSPRFFAKPWPQRELDALFALEEGGHKVILPVWHDVDGSKVVESSPLMAGRLAASWDDGCAVVVAKLLSVILDRSTVVIESVKKVPEPVPLEQLPPTKTRGDNGDLRRSVALTAAAVLGIAAFIVSFALFYLCIFAVAGAEFIVFQTSAPHDRFLGPLKLAAILTAFSSLCGYVAHKKFSDPSDGDEVAVGCLFTAIVSIAAGYFSLLAGRYMFPNAWEVRVTSVGRFLVLLILGLLAGFISIAASVAFKRTLRWWSEST